MKKAVALVLLLTATICNAQRYYPGLDDIFVNDDDPEETVFYEEIAWFKQELRKATKKVWMANLQTSRNGNAAFYSLSLVPKWVYEVNFLDTGVLLKYNNAKEDKTSYIPLTCTEHIDVRNEKKGNGRMQFYEGGIALEFPREIMTPYSSEFKTDLPDGKCLLELANTEYVFDPGKKNLTIVVTGKFNTGLKVGKQIIESTAINSVTVTAAKGLLTIDLTYTDPKKGRQIITLVTKKV